MQHEERLVDRRTMIDGVFEQLLEDIVSGKRAAGARLPGERELSRRLGVSRPTLREALRRLEEWNVVRARRGVGINIRPYRDWSIEVITAYLHFGKPRVDQPTLDTVLSDTLAIRRALVLEIIRMTALRVSPAGMRAARLAAARAWFLRDDPSYARAELDVLREIVEAASFAPGLWLLNRITDDAMAPLWLAPRAPDDYVAMYARFFDLLEAGAADEAVDLMRAYLERRDRELLDALRARNCEPSEAT